MKKVLLGMLAAAAIAVPALAAGNLLSFQIFNSSGEVVMSGNFPMDDEYACAQAKQSVKDYWEPRGYVVAADCK